MGDDSAVKLGNKLAVLRLLARATKKIYPTGNQGPGISSSREAAS